jgi:hypothetical protein
MNTQRTRVQKLYGLKWAVLPVIRKYLAQKLREQKPAKIRRYSENTVHPPRGGAIIFEVETLVLIDIATQPDFFLRPKGNAEKVRAFGQLFHRYPKETIELLKLIQDELTDNYFHNKRIRRHLLANRRKQSDAQITEHLNKEKPYLQSVKKTSVVTERQRLLDELEAQAKYQTSTREIIAKYGIVPPAKRR